MVEEARLEKGPSGLAPATDGWFTVNVRDAGWITSGTFGSGCRFENAAAPFAQLGINVRVLQPGQSNGMYHSDSGQEDFLVIAGECLVLIEGEERRLRAWDFVHCPPHTEHIFVGAGDGPCILVMTGARSEGKNLLYPVSDLARSHGASVEADTTEPAAAYASYEPPKPGRPTGWDGLPWA
jgi:uncharacterized cupin superfamily protein